MIYSGTIVLRMCGTYLIVSQFHNFLCIDEHEGTIKFQVYYSYGKLFEAIFTSMICIPVCPLLMCFMRKNHYVEYQNHGKQFLYYVVGIFLYKLGYSANDRYGIIDAIQFINDFQSNTKDKQYRSPAHFFWGVLGLHHLIVPVIILVFKKNQDIFMSFSKLDDMGRVSIFQRK